VTRTLELGTKVFAEGLTILNDEIFQLTWQEHQVFVYGLDGKLKRTMKNAREGWGLTNDGKSLIFSDGTPSLFFADPKTFEITREVKLKADRPGPLEGLNELELVDGKVYGNLFLTNTIVRIDPANGCIEATAEMGSLWRAMTAEDKKQITSSDQNVLNGIAYDKANGNFYVTGKRWRTIFVGKFAGP
jgi:glutamine cyclotransferase